MWSFSQNSIWWFFFVNSPILWHLCFEVHYLLDSQWKISCMVCKILSLPLLWSLISVSVGKPMTIGNVLFRKYLKVSAAPCCHLVKVVLVYKAIPARVVDPWWAYHASAGWCGSTEPCSGEVDEHQPAHAWCASKGSTMSVREGFCHLRIHHLHTSRNFPC